MGEMNSKAREAFCPALRLQRSQDSNTASILYSASTSRMLGKGSRLEVYVEPSELPRPVPESIELMIYVDSPPVATSKTRVYELEPHRKQPISEPTYRYTERIVAGVRPHIGDIYIPKVAFSDSRPDLCWLEITPAGGT